MADEYEIEFYADANGREPFRIFLESLNEAKRLAMMAAIERVLTRFGPGVCGSEWGRKLGGTLFELRVRHTADEVKSMFPNDADLAAKVSEAVLGDGHESDEAESAGGKTKRKKRAKKSPDKLVLRAFCNLRPGGKIVLLLGGYDKGEDPGERRQQREIEAARKRLAELQLREAKALKEAIRRGEARGPSKKPSRKGKKGR